MYSAIASLIEAFLDLRACGVLWINPALAPPTQVALGWLDR